MNVEKIKRDLEANPPKPGEDWAPAFHVENQLGEVWQLPPMPHGMMGDLGRPILRGVMVNAITRFRAVRCAFVALSWAVVRPASQLRQYGGSGKRVEDQPDKREVLCIEYFDGPSKVVMHLGYIVREEGKPPRIERWEERPGLATGRFVDAIRPALALFGN